MFQNRVLPEPALVQHAPFCLACGYSLQGLAPPSTCPECGLYYEAGQLMLAGVPRRAPSSTPPLRRAVWVLFIALVLVFQFTWSFMLIRYHWVGVAWIVAILACLAWLLATSQRERSAYERFVITHGGIARLPYRMKEGETNIDTLFVAWGPADTFVIQRVGPFWKRLIVGSHGEGGQIINPVFDAGFRCTDDNAMTVREAMEKAMIAHRAPKEAQAQA